ncbi:MAG: DHA2 family efflux MFS transporter permease subunit [Actinobacteria bacterium]|nr:MAG: DHA2 family efflux MFS transporter permease subunit [Actinomycetota bacterium]
MANKLRHIEYKWIVAVIFVAGLFLEILDTTIVNVAIPTLAKEFDATRASMEWVVLGYLLSLAIWIPASGWIGDKVGTKKTFLFALLTFTVASALCGQAHSVGELVLFRILQGVGGGMLTPVGTTMLFRAFPPAERARASTVLLVPIVVAPALGPIIGGLLIDNLSWRWIFYVNMPLGVLGFVFGLFMLKESKEPTAGRFDIRGFLLSGIGLAGVLYALSQAPEKGWTSNSVLVSGLGGLVLLAMLVFVELRIDQPMISLRLYQDRMFRNSNMVNTLSYGSFMAFLFLFPQMIQSLMGYTALQSGFASLPQAVGMILASQFVGKLYHTVGPRRLVALGLTMVMFSSLPFVFISMTTSLWTIRASMFFRGISMAFAFVPLQASTYATISRPDTGRASAIYSTQRQASAALGVALLSTVFISREHHLLASGAPNIQAQLGGFHLAFIVSNCFAVLGSIYAFFLIHDEDAVATMVPR